MSLNANLLLAAAPEAAAPDAVAFLIIGIKRLIESNEIHETQSKQSHCLPVAPRPAGLMFRQ